MKEPQLKNLMRQSTLETSEDFTTDLMKKIEAKKAAENVQIWSFKKVLAVLVGIILVLSFVLYCFFNTSTLVAESFKMPVFIVFLLCLLIGINYIARLHEHQKRFNT